MSREQTRFFVFMLFALGAFYAAAHVRSEPLTTMLMLVLPLGFLAHIRVADESHGVYGPVWLRRAQWGFIGVGLLVAIVMLRT